MATPSPASLRQFVMLLNDKPRSYPTLNIYGNQIAPIFTGKETAGSLVVFESVTQPKGGPPRHVHHREDEAFYVVQGKFLFEYGDTRVEGGHDDGHIEIDSNTAERALRAVALGRKNYLSAGSDDGGEWAAAIYSLIGTAKLNGLDPKGYLREVLHRRPSHQPH